MFGFYLSKTICNVVGYLIPAYSTYRAIQNKLIDTYNSLIVFWIVMAAFSVLELFGDILISWLPLYYEAKIVLIIWLSLPQTRGAERIYSQFLEPWLRKNESDIDKHAEVVSQHLSDGVAHIRSTSLGFIKNKSVEILTLSTQLVASANTSANPSANTTPQPSAGAFFESPRSRRESGNSATGLPQPPPLPASKTPTSNSPTQRIDEAPELPAAVAEDGPARGLRNRKK